jgi:hypothetical protein
MFRSWNVKTGNLYSMGDQNFSPADICSIGAEAQEAIRVLTEKILDTKLGNRLATEEYAKSNKKLFTAVSFRRNGLWIKLNQNEKHICSSEDIFSGKVPGLEEIKKIHSSLERQGLIASKDLDQNARDVFTKVMQNRGNEIESPPLFDRVELLGSDNDSCVKKITRVAAFWKVILFMTGLSMMRKAFDGMVCSLTGQNHWEKFLVSCASFLEGMTIFGIAVLSFLKEISTIVQNFITKATTGAAFPVVAFAVYGLVLFAAIYKLYIQLKFKRDLDAIVGDGKDPEKLKKAILWLREQTQLSCLEINQETAGGPFVILNRKWEKFSLRVQEGMLSEILDPKRLDDILNGKDEASGVIKEVQAANKRAIVWTCVSILANLIGILATIAYLGAFGHITAGVLVVLYILATVGGVLASEQARLEFFRYLHKTIDCAKSEDQGLEEGTGCSQISSTSYEPNEASPQILSMPTEETLNHFNAS